MNNFSFAQSSSKFPVMVQKKVEAGEEVTIHGNNKEIGTRFYIDSRVVANALLYIIGIGAKKHIVGELDSPIRYHICGEKAYSNLELAQLVANLMDKPLKYKLVDFHQNQPAHDIHYGLQNNTLKEAGWEHPISLEQSLKEVIAWQTEHREWL
jgi:dTDP-glucose 4,6-dehydratase